MLSCDVRILSLDDLVSWCEAWRRRDLRIGLANGCFDVLHYGHLRLLEATRDKCNRLVVAVNSDESVRMLKGAGRPHNPEGERAALVASLSMVDAVTVFSDPTPMRVIKAVDPDVLIKGAEYSFDKIVGAQFVRSRGGEVLRVPMVPDRSTTRTLRAVV